MDVENQTETVGPKTFRSKMVTIVSLGLVCVGGALMVASTHGTVATENQMSAPVQASLARTLSGAPKYDGVPTKSPSSGVHKPTWKPSSKPVEHATKQGAALPKVMNLLETPVAAKPNAAAGAVKQAGGVPPEGTTAAHPKTATTTTQASPAIMSATAYDTAAVRALQGAAPVKPASGAGAPPAAGATGPVLPVDIVVDENVITTVDGPVTPINTPDGPVFPGDLTTDAALTKPAPQAGNGAKSAPKPAATALYTKTTIKKAGVPTKSPSSGIHKPTWKPSSKPNERRALEALPVTKDEKADPCHDGLSPRCTPPTSKPVEHASKQGAALPRALKQDFLQTTAILKSPEESLSAENLEATKVHAANAAALAAQGGKDEGISTKKVLADQQQETVYAVIAEEKTSADSKATPPGPESSSSAKKGPAPAAALYTKGGKVTTKDEKADPCHDGLSPRCTPPTSKPVEHKVRRNLAASPTKSPSSGIHKPTWRPSSKPAEHRVLRASKTEKPNERGPAGPDSKPKLPAGPRGSHRALSNAHPGDLTTSTAGKGAFAEVGPSKSPSTGIHKPTWKPTQGKPSGKPVEPWKEGVESSHSEMKNSAHSDGEIEKEHSKRRLSGYKAVGGPTKSPSTGIMKPTWKPSSKPQEDRKLKSKSSSKSSSKDASSSSSKKSSSKKSSKSSKVDDAAPPPPPPATDDAAPAPGPAPPAPPAPATDDDNPPPPAPPAPATDDATPLPPLPPAPPAPATDDDNPPPPPPPSSTATADAKGCPTCATDADCAKVPGYGPCVNGKCQPNKPEGEAPVDGKMLLPPAKNSKLSTVSKTPVAGSSTVAVVEPVDT